MLHSTRGSGNITFTDTKTRTAIRELEPIYTETTRGVFHYFQTPHNELGITISHHQRDETIGISNWHEDLHKFSIVVNARIASGIYRNYYFRPAAANITSVLRRSDANDRYIFSLNAFFSSFGEGSRWNRFNEINYISVYSQEGFFTTKDGENELFIFP